MAENSPIERGNWFIGSDHTLIYYIVDANETPQDVSTWTFTYTLSDANSVVKITKSSVTVSNGNGTNDKISIAIADTDTDALTAGYYSDILRRADPGYEQTLSFGTVYLTA